MNYIASQFSNPRGFAGHLVGLVMAYENRKRNHGALSLLDFQPTDDILEIGFGPGWAIEQAARIASKGTIAGVDYSPIMVQQAKFRNRAKVKSSRVILRHGSAAVISFEDTAFNKMFMVNSFHEGDGPALELQEANRVLLPEVALLLVEHLHGALGKEDLDDLDFIAIRIQHERRDPNSQHQCLAGLCNSKSTAF